jgi:hypothetical protein
MPFDGVLWVHPQLVAEVGRGPMVPDRAYFAVQRRFAERWATLASMPIETAYLECTTWYLQAAGLGREFDPNHPVWQKLVDQVQSSADPDGVVHAAALQNEPEVPPGPVLDWSWDADDQCVRLHFFPQRSADGHPLAGLHLPERQREFRDLVRRAALEHPDAAWLRGRSWLYSIEAYRRIFPDVFIAGLEPSEHDLQFLACWGQLLDGAWRTRSDVASLLLRGVAIASTTDDLEAAFPYAMQQSRVPFSAMVAQAALED